LAVLLWYLPAPADDKSGAGPNAISLPKGPGSIEGLGESFQPTLNTGTAKYSIPLNVPPGTAGHQPELKLSYEGGGANGPLGFGWTLPLPFIQRRTDKGIPTYGEDVGFPRQDVFINDLKEELVPLTNGYWFSKNEGAFIRYSQSGDHWRGTLPNGTQLEFGISDSARIQETNSGHVFSWLLERETDTRGNTIVFSYASFPGDQNLNQKYLAGIAYGPGTPPWASFHFVSFVYEDRPDWFEDCRAGFVVRTGKRLKRIVVGTQGSSLAAHLQGDFNNDGIPDNLNRIYELQYLDYAGTNSFWSLLASIQLIGATGTNGLPPESFGYSVANPPAETSAASQIISGINEPPFVMDNALVDLVDLNGDGLPDILKTDPGGGPHFVFLNLGESNSPAGPVLQWTGPIPVGGDPLAANVNLESTTDVAHLADIDGDGLADLVYLSAAGSVYYFANSGRLSWQPRAQMSVQDFAPPAPFGNADVRTADLDFDKRIDIIQSVATGFGADYRIWFSLDDQAYSASLTVPQTSGFLFSDPGVFIADFNGDRVPDIMKLAASTLTVTAGLGYGRFADPILVSIPDSPLTDTQLHHARLIDINGDGLADLVVERAEPGTLWYWLNRGNYSFDARRAITGMPTGISLNAVTRWADLNGNGTTDLIYADSTALPQIQAVDLGRLLNGRPGANVLVAITNGIGRITLIEYQPSTQFALADAAAGNPWPDVMPFPVQVVASVTTLDSLGHQYITQFRYHNGYYDPVEKQFRGFARADQIELGDASVPTLLTQSIFDTGRNYDGMKGKLLVLIEQQPDGSVFWAETNAWSEPPITLYTGTNGTNVVFVHPTLMAKTFLELGHGIPRRLEAEFDYDQYGNQTLNANYGVVVGADRGSFNDERITTTQYAINLTNWNVCHPARLETKDFTGTVVSRTDYFYDDETFSGNNWGDVSLANLTLRRDWITPADEVAYIRQARKKYDPYGNAVTILDPLGSEDAGGVDFSNGHVRQLLYDDQLHTYPVVEEIYVGHGHSALVFQAGYDPALGLITSTLDFNTNQTTYGYDEFGRLSHIVKPGDTVEYPTVEYDYALAVPVTGGGLVNYVESRQLDQSPSPTSGNERDHYFISRLFVDGLGRELLTKAEAEPTPGGSLPRVVVLGARQFNARQKPARFLNPCFSIESGASLDELLGFENIEAPGWQGVFHDGGALIAKSLATAPASAKSYDGVLREIQSTNPDGTVRQIKYEPLVQKILDENQSDNGSPYAGRSHINYQDGFGRLIRVDEVVRLNDDGTPASNTNVWTTLYEYDVNDQLTRLTDAQNNTKLMTYDGLQRSTSINDPDRGSTSFFYDAASNLLGTTDAKGQRITFTYDGYNRLLTEDYHDEGQSFSANLTYDPSQPLGVNNRPDVAYFYDNPLADLSLGDGTIATARNTRGALAYVWDLAGEEHTSFDERGRVEWVVKRVPDPTLSPSLNPPTSTPLVSYRTSFLYDSMDRLRQLTYPDNDGLHYDYNERSLPRRITLGPSVSIISDMGYAPSGQPETTDYGNGIRTSQAYDSRLRLTSIHTAPAQSPSSPLVAFQYDYDGVSNLKSIIDVRPAPVVPEGDPRRNTQVFGYDDLYRLIDVGYVFSVPPLPVPPDWTQSQINAGQIDYHYDRIGNLLAQTSDINQFDHDLPVANLGTMTYGGTRGSSSRLGRPAGDPPGPHALTKIRNLTSNLADRSYEYDANGNMTTVDGLTNTWDFRDRLVAIESSEMRAEYTYDYTDRRTLKRVWQKKTNSSPSGFPSQPSTTVYIDKYFEVREHDAPVKYVWRGQTRLARVAGSPGLASRVQRLRLYRGWNLTSVAVTLTNAGQQLFLSARDSPRVTDAFVWNLAAQTWSPIGAGDSIPAGSVLWLRADNQGVVTLSGVYSEPTTATLQPGESFLAAAGLEAWPPAFSTNASFWVFDGFSQSWLFALSSAAGSLRLSNVPEVIAPGQAFFANADSSVVLQMPDPALRLRYYHEDHLGSSSCVTDAGGALVQESALYPFGTARHQFEPKGLAEPYLFAQKETDAESGFAYFDSRFLATTLARFTRVDPLVISQHPTWLTDPQKLNLYAYCRNNPLAWTDPEGFDSAANNPAGSNGGATEPPKVPGAATTTSNGSAAFKFDEEGLKQLYQDEGVGTKNAQNPFDDTDGHCTGAGGILIDDKKCADLAEEKKKPYENLTTEQEKELWKPKLPDYEKKVDEAIKDAKLKLTQKQKNEVGNLLFQMGDPSKVPKTIKLIQDGKCTEAADEMAKTIDDSVKDRFKARADRFRKDCPSPTPTPAATPAAK
jgi:RHS repeat-associated protein